MKHRRFFDATKEMNEARVFRYKDSSAAPNREIEENFKTPLASSERISYVDRKKTEIAADILSSCATSENFYLGEARQEASSPTQTSEPSDSKKRDEAEETTSKKHPAVQSAAEKEEKRSPTKRKEKRAKTSSKGKKRHAKCPYCGGDIEYSDDLPDDSIMDSIILICPHCDCIVTIKSTRDRKK